MPQNNVPESFQRFPDSGYVACAFIPSELTDVLARRATSIKLDLHDKRTVNGVTSENEYWRAGSQGLNVEDFESECGPRRHIHFWASRLPLSSLFRLSSALLTGMHDVSHVRSGSSTVFQLSVLGDNTDATYTSRYNQCSYRIWVKTYERGVFEQLRNSPKATTS